MLPKLYKQKGFTLVELLVAISIIAILSVIGLTIFTQVTVRSRDSRRISDIDAIANAMETNFKNGAYVALDKSYFQSNQVPQDPVGGTSINCGEANMCKYCTVASLPSVRVTSITCTGTVGFGTPGVGATFIICANLEGDNGVGGANFYCRQNSQ